MTDKELALRIMMLLSALESWILANNCERPGYLHEDIKLVVETLRKKVLK